MKKKLFVIIGEHSGDLHGGNVLKELKKMSSHLEIIGTGGKIFQKQAKKTFYTTEELEIIGLWEVVKNWVYLKNIFQKIVHLLDKEKPDAVFLVDYVGFNLRLAKEAKKRGIYVFFYIAPQVWAWKKNRIKDIARWIDKLLVLFPFEVDFFAQENIQVECFGHPLLDIAKTNLTKKEIFQRSNFSLKQKLICLLPGSRKQEIKAHFPTLLKTVEVLSQKENFQFVCVVPSSSALKIVEEINKNSAIPPSIRKKIFYFTGEVYNFIGHSDLALVASGTVTLETAILQTPMIIFYHTSSLSFFLARYLFKIKNLGLPNIVNKKKFIPELLQNNFTPSNLSQLALKILSKETEYYEMKKEFPSLIQRLGKKGSYKKTAQFLHQLLFKK